MRHLTTAAVGLLLASAPLRAEPAKSAVLADCAGLMQVAAGWALQPEDRDRLLDASDMWLAASVEQARAEGAHYPDFMAVSLRTNAATEWRALGADGVATADFARLSQECRRIDRELALGIHSE